MAAYAQRSKMAALPLKNALNAGSWLKLIVSFPERENRAMINPVGLYGTQSLAKLAESYKLETGLFGATRIARPLRSRSFVLRGAFLVK
jgi:hypothetical protein